MGKPRDLANLVAAGNILADGAVAPAELTGVTSTASELNILDGVTATTSELNIMDGVTATTAELNHVDGVTSNVQTQMDTKAPVADPTFTGTVTGPTINASTALQIGGTAITATAAELNKMDGVTVSASDINSVTAKAPTADPTFTGTLAAPTINASTKLQVNGTDVITNARQLSNIASVDATTAAAITTAGVGSANTFEATASGALANGDPVIINANGTVSKPALTISANDPATFGYSSNSNQGPTINGTGQTAGLSAAYNSNSGTTGAGAFLVTFRDASASDALKGNMMTVRTDGELNVEGEFSIGQTVEGARATDVCFNEPLNVFFCAYRKKASNTSQVIALTPNGARTVNQGSAYTIKTDTHAPRIATDNNNDPYNFVVTFLETSNNALMAKPFQYNASNGVITVGSEVTIESSSCLGGHHIVYDSTNDKFIVTYANTGDNKNIKTKVITFDGSGNSLSVGSEVELSSVSVGDFNFGTVFTTSGKTVIAMKDEDNSNYLTTAIFTTSGTGGSFSSTQVAVSQDVDNVSIGYDDNTNRVGIAFKNNGVTNTVTNFTTASVGASSLTFQSSSPASLGTTNSERGSARMPFSGTNVGTTLDTARTGDNKLLVVYGTQGDYGRVNIANLGSTSTSLTSTNYIGISDAAYSDGQTATVQTMGAIDDAQSSLTPAAKQYVQKDGTIGSSASTPSVEAGLALSATKLLVKG